MKVGYHLFPDFFHQTLASCTNQVVKFDSTVHWAIWLPKVPVAEDVPVTHHPPPTTPTHHRHHRRLLIGNAVISPSCSTLTKLATRTRSFSSTTKRRHSALSIRKRRAAMTMWTRLLQAWTKKTWKRK